MPTSRLRCQTSSQYPVLSLRVASDPCQLFNAAFFACWNFAQRLLLARTTTPNDHKANMKQTMTMASKTKVRVATGSKLQSNTVRTRINSTSIWKKTRLNMRPRRILAFLFVFLMLGRHGMHKQHGATLWYNVEKKLHVGKT